MIVLDPGHRYAFISLDGNYIQELRFVKREGKKFPGNSGAYSGTIIQDVLRTVIERISYLQKQTWCFENALIYFLLSIVVWLLEFRAARRHRKLYMRGLNFASKSKMCLTCGHTICDCLTLNDENAEKSA